MKRARPGKKIIWSGFALILLILAATSWVGVRGVLAKGELESAIPLASTIQAQIVSGEGTAAGATAVELGKHSAAAARLTSDPIWQAFEALPFLGPNLVAVRQLSAVVDDVAKNAVVPLAHVAGKVKLADFKPVDGAINLQALVDAQAQFEAADSVLSASERQLASIDTSATLSIVRGAADKLVQLVAEATQSVGNVNRAVRLVPSMLGSAGPRNYLLLFQNPAELRATGGIPGAVALIHTESGRIALTQQASGSALGFPEPVLELPAETRGLYGDITGEYMQDVNLTPNFPLSAKLAREMWLRKFGTQVDGVISIDPVALSYLLRATGPITLASGDVLTADNAVQLLLSDVYARYTNPADQDAFFAAAAASVFSAVSSGDADPVALVTALAQAGSEHRVLIWSAHDDDQAMLAGTTLAGGLPESDESATRFGVYLNDGTGAKMGAYLDMHVALGQVTCRKDERPNYQVSVTLSNTAPSDAASKLSGYVTGGGSFGVTPGNVKTVVSVYGVPGMQNLGIARDDAITDYHPATDSTYPVSSTAVELTPGETTVVHFGWLGLKPSRAPIVAQMTPVIHMKETSELELSCESALW